MNTCGPEFQTEFRCFQENHLNSEKGGFGKRRFLRIPLLTAMLPVLLPLIHVLSPLGKPALQSATPALKRAKLALGRNKVTKVKTGTQGPKAALNRVSLGELCLR